MRAIKTKIKQIETLISELYEELNKYQNENASEEEQEKFNETEARLDTVGTALEDFEDAFNDMTDGTDHEEFYFNDDYNGVSQADFYETFYIQRSGEND